MTKIKNTKKGMAKKTLSMSLVVAMLATSNVPVWAAEFSDGTDAAVATEAPAAETFSDETAEAPVVDNEEVAPVAEAATNNKLNASVDFSFGSDAVKNNSVTWDIFKQKKLTATLNVTSGEAKLTDFTEVKALWKVDGNQADANVTTVTTGKETVEILPTADMAEAGSKLTLYIYAKDANGIAWSYTSDPISVEKVDINKVNDSADVKVASTGIGYDGEDHTPVNSMIELPPTWTNNGWDKNDFTIGEVSGDTKNVTDDGVTVTLVPKKAGFTGVLTRKYQINPLTLTSKNIGEYIKAEVVNKTVAYTGNTIAPKNTDVKLTDKKTGADLSGYIDSVTGISQKADYQAGKSHKLIINLKASNDDGKVKNYTINTRACLKNILNCLF